MKHGSASADYDAVAGELGLELPPGAVERLEAYEALLRERGAAAGVISEADVSRLRTRHMLDSLRAAAAVGPDDRLAYDVGSGGGLPGAVVAAACPTLRVELVEPRRSRIAFLELVIERVGLRNAVAVPGRIEQRTGPADLAFARAFAPLPQAWASIAPVLRAGGRLVYFAGRDWTSASVPEGASRVEVVEGPVLERAGPLIIMTR